MIIYYRKACQRKSSAQGRYHHLSEAIDSTRRSKEFEEDHIEPHIMTEKEIILKYWKLLVRFLIYFGASS